MYALVGLVAFLVLTSLIAIFGWGVDSRDGRDWTTGNRSPRGNGARNLPASWVK